MFPEKITCLRDPSIRLVNVTNQAHVHKTNLWHFKSFSWNFLEVERCFSLTIESSINLGQKAQNFTRRMHGEK